MAWNLSDPSFGKDYMELQEASFPTNRPKSSETHFQSYRQNTCNIMPKLKQFKDENKYCDVDIRVGDTVFQAHRIVLAAQSPYFASLLDPLMKSLKDRLLVENLEPALFSEFLGFLYCGVIIPKESNFITLLNIAKQFHTDTLSTVCEEYMCQTLNVSNFVNRLLTSHKYGLKGAANEIISFGRHNFSNIVQQSEFLCIPPVKFYKLLTILKLGPSDVEVKLGLISHWVGYNINEREKLVLHLLTCIDWTLPPSDVIKFITESENLFTANEYCLFQLMHRLYITFQQLGPYFNTYEGLSQVYKDITDTDFPKVLSETEKLDDAAQFNVSLDECSSHENNSAVGKPLLKDACLNTDIDSTNINELAQPTPPIHVDTPREIRTIAVNIKKEIAQAEEIGKEITVLDTIEGIVDLDSIQTQINTEESKTDSVEKVEKEKKQSRRKGRPKKHTKDSDQVGDESAEALKVKIDKKAKPKIAVNGKSPNEKGTLRIKIKALSKKPEKPEDDADSSRIVKVERDEKEGRDENSDTDHYLSDFDRLVGDEGQTSVEDTKKLNEDSKTNSKKKLLKKKATRLRGTKQGNSAMFRRKQMKDKIQRARKPDTRPSRMKNVPFIKCTEEGCDYKSKNDKYFKRHVEMVHTLKIMLKCKQCDFSASLMRDLCHHVKKHYPDGPPYICEKEGCDYQGLRMGLFIRHQMDHTDERPYSCEICNKSFRTENQLSCHKKLHEGRQFVCDVCNKRFTTKGGMQTHRAVHFDNKPYLCDWCGFSTKHQSHLISHRKLHTGEVKRCTFPNCNYTTPKTGHMTQHINCHLNIRNHTCQVCGKSFVVRSKLLRHEKIHLEQKLFKCKSCDYQTSRTDRMKLHIQSHGAHLRKKSGVKFPKVQFDEEFDYSQMYEKVEPTSNSFYTQMSPIDNNEKGTTVSHDNLVAGMMDNVSVSMATMVTDPVMTSLGTTEPGQLAFGQGSYRQLDLLSVAAAGLEQFAKMQGASFQHSYDQHHGTYESI